MAQIKVGSTFLDGKLIESVDGAQEKADSAEQNAKDYADLIDSEKINVVSGTIESDPISNYPVGLSVTDASGRDWSFGGDVLTIRPSSANNGFQIFLPNALSSSTNKKIRYYSGSSWSDEVEIETTVGAQDKADTAEQNAKDYADLIDSEKINLIEGNFSVDDPITSYPKGISAFRPISSIQGFPAGAIDITTIRSTNNNGTQICATSAGLLFRTFENDALWSNFKKLPSETEVQDMIDAITPEDIGALPAVDTPKINLKDPTTLTISGGAITVTQGYHIVDTEGGAALDDLTTINGGSIGDLLILRITLSARKVRLVNLASGGNITITGRDDLTLGTTTHLIMLQKISTVWSVIGIQGAFLSEVNSERVNWIAPNSKTASDPLSSFQVGITLMRTSVAAGFPATFGDVTTYNSSSYGHQEFHATLTNEKWRRNWHTNNNAWLSWEKDLTTSGGTISNILKVEKANNQMIWLKRTDAENNINIVFENMLGVLRYLGVANGQLKFGSNENLLDSGNEVWHSGNATYGSNANGNYIRFPNGVQICAAMVSLAYQTVNSVGYNWTFPAQFISSPVVNFVVGSTVNVTPEANELGLQQVAPITTSSAVLYQVRIKGMTSFVSGDTIDAYPIAYGRWK